VGPQIRSGRSGEKKSHHWPCRKLNPGRLARSLATILTEQRRLFTKRGAGT